ncbi:MAG: pyruvate kinase, partial [Planctomycetota bacterium]|nr:pyruvate kinase [Planctomycetota bacterium]
MKDGPPARTTVVATVGPACRGADVLSRLIEAGVGVLRLNLSHGELGEHLELLETIRATEERLGVPVAVMADLPGPKIRLHACSDTEILEGAVVDVQEGDLPSTDADV